MTNKKKTRAPLEVVLAYTDEFWNKKNFNIADDIIGDSLTRHIVGAPPTVLSREEVKERGQDLINVYPQWNFELIRAFSDKEMVCAIYQAVGIKADGSTSRLGSIEVFQVVDGKIVSVWNNSTQQGLWNI